MTLIIIIIVVVNIIIVNIIYNYIVIIISYYLYTCWGTPGCPTPTPERAAPPASLSPAAPLSLRRLFPRVPTSPSLAAARPQAMKNMLASSFTFAAVHGKAGVGKTSLVTAALDGYFPDKCTYAYGRFDEPRFATPYSGLNSAFAHLLSRSSEVSLAPWRQSLRQDIGDKGQLLKVFAPRALLPFCSAR